MKKRLLTSLAVVAVGSAFLVSDASALTWTVSPYSPTGGTTVFGSTNVVGVQDILDPETGAQVSGIYGAGFMSASDSLLFDVDLYTWDAYSATGDASQDGGGKGWYDAFVVNINQQGFYWDLVSGGSGAISDPIVSASYGGGYGTFDDSVLPGKTFVFGGEDYGNGTLEELNNAPANAYTLSLGGLGDPNLPYYISVVLDTKTTPNADGSYPSWGSFHVNPVPEPATMFLFGTGLAGLAAMRRRKSEA